MRHLRPLPRPAAGAFLLLAMVAAPLWGCDPTPRPDPNLGPPTPTSTVAASPPAPLPDENAPATHLARLSHPQTSAAAVDRLFGFFEDTMTLDQKNREGPTVKPLLDAIVKPLNDACLTGNLAEGARSRVIQLLSHARRPEGGPCLVKALEDYKPDATEEDVKWAARGVGVLRLQSAAGPLFDVFTKLKPSRPKAAAMYRDVYNALLTIADPSWEPALIANLEKPPNNQNTREWLLDEVQWSMVTSAKILGDAGSVKAVPALIKVMLTPAKADAHMTSVLALVKIGKPATDAAIALLEGRDKDLIKHSEAETLRGLGEKVTADQKKQAGSAHIATAGLILGVIGRDESRAPLLAALKKADPVPRAIIARELPKVPKNADTLRAFQTAFEKTPLTLSLPPASQNALESLLDAMPTFFDASLVPWLLKVAGAMKGDETDVAGFKESAFLAMIKMMKADQLAAVEKFAAGKNLGADGRPSTVGEPFKKELAQCKALLQACGDKVECYLAKLAEPASQEEQTLITGIKAVYMVGILGAPDVRDKLMDLLPKLKNTAMRGLAATVIDFHSPRGDVELAHRLQKIVQEADANNDLALKATQSHLRCTIYRLRARAQ